MFTFTRSDILKKTLTLFLLCIFIFFYPEKSSGGNAYWDIEIAAHQVAEDKAFKYGLWALRVIDAKSGSKVIGINDSKSVIPASVLKLLTTSTALTTFGPHHTFKTQLAHDGTITNGVLEGNLYILGGGDPTLGSVLFKRFTPLITILKRWHEALTAQGITKISGEVIADDTWFSCQPISEKWAWEDIGNYYGAGAYGLNIYDNLFFIFFKPSQKPGHNAPVVRISPKINGILLNNEVKTGPKGSGDNAYVFGGPQQLERYLTGTVPAGRHQFAIKGSMPDPPLFAAQRLRKFLIDNNISVEKQARVIRNSHEIKERPHLIILDTVESPSLKDIIYVINKKSMNLYADVLLKHLGREKYGRGSFTYGTKTVIDFLREKAIDAEGFFMYDGSGLSRANAITAKTLVEVLKVMFDDPYSAYFYNSLPVAGDPNDFGTMKDMLRNTEAAKKVRAKTGSLERVKSHAGYVESRSGKVFCFAMIANNFAGTHAHINWLHQKIMMKIFELP
jgi:D-alanyl-D-alanine carboxypeptidase/D-alanyl-D-alanine-endopeptidase (penicillin-binding protein 4)